MCQETGLQLVTWLAAHVSRARYASFLAALCHACGRGCSFHCHVLDTHHFWRHFVTLAGRVAAFIVLVRRVEGCEFHCEYFFKRINWKSIARVCRADLDLRECQCRQDCPTRCITTGHCRHNRYVSRYVCENLLVRTEMISFTMCTGNICLCITDTMFNESRYVCTGAVTVSRYVCELVRTQTGSGQKK